MHPWHRARGLCDYQREKEKDEKKREKEKEQKENIMTILSSTKDAYKTAVFRAREYFCRGVNIEEK